MILDVFKLSLAVIAVKINGQDKARRKKHVQGCSWLFAADSMPLQFSLLCIEGADKAPGLHVLYSRCASTFVEIAHLMW